MEAQIDIQNTIEIEQVFKNDTFSQIRFICETKKYGDKIPKTLILKSNIDNYFSVLVMITASNDNDVTTDTLLAICTIEKESEHGTIS